MFPEEQLQGCVVSHSQDLILFCQRPEDLLCGRVVIMSSWRLLGRKLAILKATEQVLTTLRLVAAPTFSFS